MAGFKDKILVCQCTQSGFHSVRPGREKGAHPLQAAIRPAPHPRARGRRRGALHDLVVLGAHCRLHSHVVIDGHTRLGRGNEIFPFASIGLKTQDLKWKGGLTRTQIGDHNTFREYVTIHSATGDGETTVVGSNNHILAYCHIAHNVTLGNRVTVQVSVTYQPLVPVPNLPSFPIVSVSSRTILKEISIQGTPVASSSTYLR